MRRSAMVASDPWTLVITLVEASLAEAEGLLERDYGLSPADWVDLE
jgi:hypothetical protein